MLWCCFPVGAFLLFQNVAHAVGFASKKSVRLGQGTKLSGVILVCVSAFFALFCVWLAVLQDPDVFVVIAFVAFVVFLFVTGIVLWRRGNLKEKQSAHFQTYLNVVGTKSSVPLTALASSVGQTVEQTVKDLRGLLSAGYFKGCYVDVEKGVFVTRNTDPFEEANDKRSKVVRCKQCGASKVVYRGEVTECDYCGSSLE